MNPEKYMKRKSSRTSSAAGSEKPENIAEERNAETIYRKSILRGRKSTSYESICRV